MEATCTRYTRYIRYSRYTLQELLEDGASAAPLAATGPKLKHVKRKTDNRQSKGRKALPTYRRYGRYIPIPSSNSDDEHGPEALLMWITAQPACHSSGEEPSS